MNSYSVKLTQEQAQKAKQMFEQSGAAFDKAPYSIWRAKTPSLQAVCYTSGKLLLQGKDVSAAAEKICSIAGIDFEIKEKSAVQQQIIEIPEKKYIGTDESGKGDFFGPLVAAGVQADGINNKKFIDLGIKDSKLLDDARILKMADFIKANAVHSVIVIMPKKYNELYLKFNNLNKLLAWAHARAIENILEKSPCGYALADKFGDESLIQNALMTKGRNIVLKQIVRAEADIAAAAASVLARAEFVKRMNELSARCGINLSKGVSPAVKKQAEEFIKKYSYSRLNEIAKMHFKTAKELQMQ